MEFSEIFERLEHFGCKLVEVTGGEPLAQKNANLFITELCDQGYEVLLETGGFFSIAEVDPRAKIILDVKCPGSGEAERNYWPNLELLRPEKDEVKFVVADRDDWEFAKSVIIDNRLKERAKELLISPVHDIDNLAELASEIASGGLPVRLNLQIHKYIWGATARGV